MPPGSPGLRSILTTALHALLLLALAALVYRQYGFAGPLTRDDAICLYSGQQMARGIPPYLSIWDHKGWSCDRLMYTRPGMACPPSESYAAESSVA